MILLCRKYWYFIVQSTYDALARLQVVDSHGFGWCCAESSEGSQWSGKNLVEESSAFLVSLAPVRDVILVKEAMHCPDPFLLLACGNSPASTLRK